jgi:hypothetical protein
MSSRVSLAVLIVVGGLLAAACEGSSSFAAAPGAGPGATPHPTAQASPAAPRTPSGIFISTRVRPTALAAIATATLESGSNTVVVQGRVFDAGRGQRLSNALIEWQFLSPSWQHHNGHLQVPADGLYRLQLPIRGEDEVIITAHAPGYLPSTARLLGRQLNLYGSRLNFGLVAADGPAPTLPGALGTIQLSGIVYNSTRGLRDPIANARVTIVDRSVVQPAARIDATTSASGTFLIPVALHTTDQIDVKIAASGYQTVTLTRSATELARKPQLAIGLQPAPKQ